jgi:hypothetical protein
MALEVSQLPNAATFPTIFMVCPYIVVTISLKVTETVEAEVQAVEVLVAGVVD